MKNVLYNQTSAFVYLGKSVWIWSPNNLKIQPLGGIAAWKK